MARAINLRVASPVIVIGYPMDLPAAPSLGLVAGFDQKFLGNYLPTTHIRANVPVQSGEQGAPMLNEKGEVVGILMCRFDYGAACLGLPIQAAEKVRADYLRFGRVSPGWIGVTAAPVDGDESRDMVKVTGLAEDAPAAHCGLEEGDVILKVGHTPVHRFADLRDASFFLTAEEKVPITVQRGEKELTVEVRAANPPGFHVGPDASENPMDSGPRLALPAVSRGAEH
jgi:S1-C subfamily serine protease